MRTTDFCFSLPDYEYPCFVSYRHLFEAYASPLANGLASTTRRPVNLAFHDAESASAGFFRVGARHDSSGAPVGAVPLTPLSLPILRLRAFAWRHRPGCRGRFLRLSVKRRRALQPEVTSIVESPRVAPLVPPVLLLATLHAHAWNGTDLVRDHVMLSR